MNQEMQNVRSPLSQEGDACHLISEFTSNAIAEHRRTIAACRSQPGHQSGNLPFASEVVESEHGNRNRDQRGNSLNVRVA